MHPQQNYNPIRIPRNFTQLQHQQFSDMQDVYLLKTHPSSLINSSFKSKNPKTSTAIKPPQKPQENSHFTQTQTNRNLNSYTRSPQQRLDSTLRQSFRQLATEKQQILYQKVLKLTKRNKIVEDQNIKLKNYVEFLQDYNLRLKNQLMRSIRRRNIDSSMSNFIQQEKTQNYRKMHPSPFESELKERPHSQAQNIVFSNFQPHFQQHSVSKPIFTNKRLAANYSQPYRIVSFGNDPYNESLHTKYVPNFIETPQEPLPNYYVHKKAHKQKNSLKNYPYSLQSSMLNASSSDANPEMSAKYNMSQKLCACGNNSAVLGGEMVDTPLTGHQNCYRSLQNTTYKTKEKTVSTKKKLVCQNCLKSFKPQQKRTKKNAQKHQKQKDFEDHSTKRRCTSCNEIKESKRATNGFKNLKGREQNPYTSIFLSNQLSQKGINNKKKGKTQKRKQKITFVD